MSIQLELILATYDRADMANDALRVVETAQKQEKVEIVTAAVVVKDATGQTKIERSIEQKRKSRTRWGAAAGGLLAVLAPPVGAAGVLASMVVGAFAGRKSAGTAEHELASVHLRELLDSMSGDSAALVLLVNSDSADILANQLAESGGIINRSVLSEDELERLSDASGNQGPVVPVETAAHIRERTKGAGLHFEKVQVIVNPASGQDQAILNTLNTVFHNAGIDWDIAITKKSGDATRLAAEAAAGGADVVAAYGGDGTQMEAASGLMGTGVPLAILPGGTNNVLSVELGVPRELAQAAALIAGAPAELRQVDMATSNDHKFILRVGIGYEAVINEGADREAKDRFGGMAYTIAGLKALKNPPAALYKMVLDGEEVEVEGLTVMIANSASLGPKLNLVRKVSVSDGLLDVIVVRRADLSSLVSVAGSVGNFERVGEPLPHWQVKEVSLTADPPMAVTGDGEMWENTPLTAAVLPAAVTIVVPAA